MQKKKEQIKKNGKKSNEVCRFMEIFLFWRTEATIARIYQIPAYVDIAHAEGGRMVGQTIAVSYK